MVVLGEGGPFGKAKWLSVVDVGGNLDDLGHSSWWWTWGGANGKWLLEVDMGENISSGWSSLQELFFH